MNKFKNMRPIKDENPEENRIMLKCMAEFEKLKNYGLKDSVWAFNMKSFWQEVKQELNKL